MPTVDAIAPPSLSFFPASSLPRRRTRVPSSTIPACVRTRPLASPHPSTPAPLRTPFPTSANPTTTLSHSTLHHWCRVVIPAKENPLTRHREGRLDEPEPKDAMSKRGKAKTFRSRRPAAGSMAKSSKFRGTGPRPSSTPTAYSSVYKRSRPKMPLSGPTNQPPQLYEDGLGYAASGKMIVEAAREKKSRQQRDRLTAMARRRKQNEKAIGYREGLFGAPTNVGSGVDERLTGSKSMPTLPTDPPTPSTSAAPKRGRGKSRRAKGGARSSLTRRRESAKAEAKGYDDVVVDADADPDAGFDVGGGLEADELAGMGLEDGTLEREIEAAIARELQREKGITDEQVAEFVATVVSAHAVEADADAKATERFAPEIKYESDAVPSLTLEHRLPTDFSTAHSTEVGAALTLEIEEKKGGFEEDWTMVERDGPGTEASTSGVLKLVGQVPIIATSKTLLYGPAFEEHEELRSPKLVRMRKPPAKDHELLVRVAANVLSELWRNQICDDYGTDDDPEPAQWKKALLTEAEFNEWFEPALHDELVRDLSGKTGRAGRAGVAIGSIAPCLVPKLHADPPTPRTSHLVPRTSRLAPPA